MQTDPEKSRTDKRDLAESSSAAGASTASTGAGGVSTVAGWASRLAAAGVIGPPASPGQEGRLDRFALLKLLGAGGMGVVFMARDTGTGQKVAVKVLRPELRGQTDVRERFLREARHLQKLKHPDIVPVLEVNERMEGPFFVMPLFEGRSLATKLKEGKPLESQDILNVAVPVAEALSHAHAKGIIHRDIKPGNILLDAGGLVCLADFGLARTLFDDAFLDVEADQCEGTGPYLSPAVAAGEAEDTRCDIYGLGAVLYHGLTGRPPYRGRTIEEIRTQIRESPPKPIRELNPEADPLLVHIAEAAMARDLDDRYASMDHLARDLRRLKEGKRPFGPHGVGRLWASGASFIQGKRARILLAAAMFVGAVGLWLFSPKARLEVISIISDTNNVPSWAGSCTAQWDTHLGKDLLVIAKGSSNLFAASTNGRPFLAWRCPGGEINSSTILVNPSAWGAGQDEVLVGWCQESNLFLSAIRADNSEPARFSTAGAPPDPLNRNNRLSRYGLLNPLRVVSATERGEQRLKVLASFQTGYGHSWRALCCFDWKTGKEDWRYRVGPVLRDLVVAPMDRDKKEAYLCGSNSPGNGNQGEDGGADTNASIFAFSPAGNLLWRRDLAGEYYAAKVLSADLDERGLWRILAWTSGHELHHGTNHLLASGVVQLDQEGKPVAQYHPRTCLQSCLVGDLEGDGRPEIICADCQGVVRVLKPDRRPDLRLLYEKRVFDWAGRRSHRFDRVQVNLVGISRLSPGGKPCLVAECRMRRQDKFTNPGNPNEPDDLTWQEHLEILVLDAQLRLVARYPIAKREKGTFPWGVEMADMDGDGVDEILLLTDHVKILKLR